jgi:prevent-host-death family protein
MRRAEAGSTKEKARAATFAHRPNTTLVTATDAKNSLGKVLEMAERGGRVLVTRRGAPAVVVLSFEDYEALAATGERALEALAGGFDDWLARMQEAGPRKAADDLFASTPADLGQAAMAPAATDDEP